MDKFLIVLIVATTLPISHASDCCSAYTDLYGTYHPSELCVDYCCWKLSTTDFKVCCSDPSRQVPATERDNDDCVQNWISEHIWVPIVGGILFLAVVIGVCTCCCCCGCCACCRRSPQPVVIHSSGGMPASTVVAMSSQTMTNQNPLHYGYEQ